jgi:hypothetical protein
MASVMAGLCMAAGHHQSTGQETQDGHHSDDGHDHAAHSHDGHDVTTETAGDARDDGRSAHCGPCMACCASASISHSPGISIPSPASAARHVFSQFPAPSVQLDGPDRPPLAL